MDTRRLQRSVTSSRDAGFRASLLLKWHPFSGADYLQKIVPASQVGTRGL